MLAELDVEAWTVIDQVVVGPSGVFVIASQDWTGRITTVGGVLRQKNVPQPQLTRDAHAAAAAVGALLTSVSPEHVVPVLCFLNGDVPDLVLDDVQVCSIVTLIHQLTTRPTVLTEAEVAAVATELKRSMPPTATEAPRSPTQRSPRTVVSLLAGLALAVVLVANPAPFHAVSDGITGLFLDQTTPSDEAPTPTPATKRPTNQKQPAKKNK